jgi:hypothetical protein
MVVCFVRDSMFWGFYLLGRVTSIDLSPKR